MPEWDFDLIHRQARDLWSKAIDRLAVEGGTEEHKTMFYSALYRAFLYPQIFADLDGNYFGGDQKVHHSDRFTNVTIFSGWDDFRSEYPLLTLVAPKAVNDEINSMVELAEDNGTHYLDRWELMGNYTVCMIGNPQLVVINDAWQKGIRGFDIAKAYTQCINTSEKYGNGKLGYTPDRFPRPRSMDWMTGRCPDWRPVWETRKMPPNTWNSRRPIENFSTRMPLGPMMRPGRTPARIGRDGSAQKMGRATSCPGVAFSRPPIPGRPPYTKPDGRLIMTSPG